MTTWANCTAAIAQVVPAGVGQGNGSAQSAANRLLADGRAAQLSDKQRVTAGNQLGSLGSGNHFVEVCLDERDRVWVVLHSGSRGIGNQLAKVHIEGAKGLMSRYFIDLDDPDLAYLVEGTAEFDSYIAAMLWSQDYALANREVMMDAVLGEVAALIGHDFDEVQRINCHHNFTEREHHMGRNMWITRKGAIRARTGDLGVIPGSMGTRSYIVEGAGSAASYHSCSHGAGRRLSRGQARRELDMGTFVESMDGKAWNIADAAKLLDEDPRSYKDIDQVMEDQKDLVEVRHTLSQVLNYRARDDPRTLRSSDPASFSRSLPAGDGTIDGSTIHEQVDPLGEEGDHPSDLVGVVKGVLVGPRQVGGDGGVHVR